MPVSELRKKFVVKRDDLHFTRFLYAYFNLCTCNNTFKTHVL